MRGCERPPKGADPPQRAGRTPWKRGSGRPPGGGYDPPPEVQDLPAVTARRVGQPQGGVAAGVSKVPCPWTLISPTYFLPQG